MTPATILSITLAILLAVLAFLAAKYPRGRADWGRDRAETVSIIATTLTFVVLFLLLWYASATIDWPDAATIMFWSGVAIVSALAVIALLVPRGLDRGHGKSKE